MPLVGPTVTDSCPYDRPLPASALDRRLRGTSPGSRFLLAFPKYLGGLVVAGIDELSDLALNLERCWVVEALLLEIRVAVIAN